MNTYEQHLGIECVWHEGMPVPCPECERIEGIHLDQMVDAYRERDL